MSAQRTQFRTIALMVFALLWGQYVSAEHLHEPTEPHSEACETCLVKQQGKSGFAGTELVLSRSSFSDVAPVRPLAVLGSITARQQNARSPPYFSITQL